MRQYGLVEFSRKVRQKFSTPGFRKKDWRKFRIWFIRFPMSRNKTILVAILFTAFAAYVFGVAMTPSPLKVKTIALGTDRVLLDREGRLVQTLRTDFNKRRLAWTPLQSFPEAIQQAVTAAEDRRFRSHFGFDPIGLGRALWSDLRGQHVQGASTITMQLADLIQDDVLLKNRQIQKGSFLHKLAQIGRAVFLETRWSKNEILEAYLNLIHLRGEFQGVPACSFAYLNKHPLALDSAESAVIASMISSPNQNAASLKRKACGVLRVMNASEESCEPTDRAVAAFFDRAPALPASPGIAPHLARRLFKEHPDESIVTSTIDARLQEKVISILTRNIERLKSSNVHDSAAIVIDNKSGQVLAYVGAIATSLNPHVDGLQAYRQAGSSLKPFLYGKAFEMKTLNAASILLDEPTAISWNGDVYRPSNYDKHFYGPVTVREALASSLNVPAVKTVTIIGLHQAYQTLQDVGLTNLREPDYYGVSLALGAVEVRLEDLANAYRMLANGGEWSALSYTRDQGKAPPTTRRVFPTGVAYILSSILSDPNARSIGFGWENPLETPSWAAVKTGTSKDYRDNWTVGFSERYTVGVWTGNFDASAMEHVSGVTGAGPSWFEIMSELQGREHSGQPAAPADVVAKDVRPAWASRAHREYFLRGTEPAVDVIEAAPDKRVEFIFPAEGSVLVKDPHLDQDLVALFVRYKGQVPAGAHLSWDKRDLGPATSPFRVDKPEPGEHELALVADGKSLGSVRFRIR